MDAELYSPFWELGEGVMMNPRVLQPESPQFHSHNDSLTGGSA